MKEPFEHSLMLSKEDAAYRQIQVSISSFYAGDYDIAITLAGAAEDLFVGDPDVELSNALLKNKSAVDKFGYQNWKQTVNYERNWLKHRTPDLPDNLTLTLDITAFYIYRAMRKLPLEYISNEMLRFEEWYRARIIRQVNARV